MSYLNEHDHASMIQTEDVNKKVKHKWSLSWLVENVEIPDRGIFKLGSFFKKRENIDD